MLPKQNRLKKKKDFERVMKQGKGFRQGFLFLKINQNDLDISRFGFIVSKKNSKKAVVRNRLKRQLREVVKVTLPNIKKGIDCVLIALSGAEDKSFQEIEESIAKIFANANINAYPVRE